MVSKKQRKFFDIYKGHTIYHSNEAKVRPFSVETQPGHFAQFRTEKFAKWVIDVVTGLRKDKEDVE